MEKMNSLLLKLLVPMACVWAKRQEVAIRRTGVALTPEQIEDARRIGVREPAKVRLQVVERVPPLNWMLRIVGQRLGLISESTIGMTLRYGIFIRADHWGERRLVVHELAHTAQYERLGGFRPFLQAYLLECLTEPGYPFGDLEIEAKRIEYAICG